MLDSLIDFLHSELKISADAISLAQKEQDLQPHILPIVLWQYGLLNTQQLAQVFDWLEVS
ncbi:MAG: DUF2949 domain-containing protein [Cyanobacteria bacterium P01_G01_bin.67]